MLAVRNLRSSHIEVDALDVVAGECVAIVGPSGSGKSLFLRAIVDLDENEGDIRLGDISHRAMPAPDWRRRVALVPAESGWWADKVADHFTGKLEDPALFKRLGMPPDAWRWTVDRLSSGEKHRLAIARALQQGPSVLLADEPTASLDEESTALVESELRRVLERGMGIILVTHDPAQADRMAKRTLTMRDGRLRGHTELAS